jgi:hypothetical protein
MNTAGRREPLSQGIVSRAAQAKREHISSNAEATGRSSTETQAARLNAAYRPTSNIPGSDQEVWVRPAARPLAVVRICARVRYGILLSYVQACRCRPAPAARHDGLTWQLRNIRNGIRSKSNMTSTTPTAPSGGIRNGSGSTTSKRVNVYLSPTRLSVPARN